MLRNHIFFSSAKRFQQRGKELFRIEALSDAVFGFSVSLLVASLEVPKSFEELKAIAAGAIPFFATVAMIFSFWYRQYIFFRRYGVNDLTTIFLNLAYLAVILFYVYPLKFLFTLLLSYWSGIDFSGTGEKGFGFLSGEEFPQLIILFSIGYLLIWLIVYLMHRHVLRLGRGFDFTEYEWLFTRNETRAALLNVFVGSASLVLAWFHLVVLASLCYLVIPLLMIVNDLVFKRSVRKIKIVQKSTVRRRRTAVS
jgi:uncharacterized membrane protein